MLWSSCQIVLSSKMMRSHHEACVCTSGLKHFFGEGFVQLATHLLSCCKNGENWWQCLLCHCLHNWSHSHSNYVAFLNWNKCWMILELTESHNGQFHHKSECCCATEMSIEFRLFVDRKQSLPLKDDALRSLSYLAYEAVAISWTSKKVGEQDSGHALLSVGLLKISC